MPKAATSASTKSPPSLDTTLLSPHADWIAAAAPSLTPPPLPVSACRIAASSAGDSSIVTLATRSVGCLRLKSKAHSSEVRLPSSGGRPPPTPAGGDAPRPVRASRCSVSRPPCGSVTAASAAAPARSSATPPPSAAGSGAGRPSSVTPWDTTSCGVAAALPLACAPAAAATAARSSRSERSSTT